MSSSKLLFSKCIFFLGSVSFFLCSLYFTAHLILLKRHFGFILAFRILVWKRRCLYINSSSFMFTNIVKFQNVSWMLSIKNVLLYVWKIQLRTITSLSIFSDVLKANHLQISCFECMCTCSSYQGALVEVWSAHIKVCGLLKWPLSQWKWREIQRVTWPVDI